MYVNVSVKSEHSVESRNETQGWGGSQKELYHSL